MDDWKLRGIKRRDDRATKVEDPRRQSGSRKNTRRLCRGVVGREHDPKCSPYGYRSSPIFDSWRTLACANCGRHIEYWYGRDPRPEWVTE